MNSYKGIMIALEVKRPDGIPVFPLVRDWAIRQAGFNFILSSGCSIRNFSISWGICRAIRHNKAYIKSGSMGMSFFAPCP